ncbi:MAG: peptidase E [Proteobacteria bacterium]|nr:peptidase E [Pseudomonadota bacterium]
MAVFVLIGGGELRDLETLKIDESIVQLSNTTNPKLLFIPTASHDSEGYIKTIEEVFGEKLGCICDSLCVSNSNITYSEIELKIGSADIIYVGGGDTKYLIDIWKKEKVDRALKKVINTNKVLCGLSAGSMCWFEKGISDTEIFSSNTEWNYSLIDGLKIIPGIHCPHLDDREDEDAFNRYLKKKDIEFIGIENNCAIVIENDKYRIIQSNKNKHAYLVKVKNGNITKEKLNEFGNISEFK